MLINSDNVKRVLKVEADQAKMIGSAVGSEWNKGFVDGLLRAVALVDQAENLEAIKEADEFDYSQVGNGYNPGYMPPETDFERGKGRGNGQAF